MMNKVGPALGLLTMAGLIAACGGTTPAQRSSSPSASSGPSKTVTVNVGAVYPLTGTEALNGQDELHGVQLAVDVLNGQYPSIGLPALTGKKINLTSLDTESNPSTAATEVQTLVASDHVVGIMGAFESGVTASASEEANRLQVPFVTDSSNLDSLTTRGYTYFFRTAADEAVEVDAYYSFLKQMSSSHPVSTAVIVYRNDAFGGPFASLIQSTAAAHGINIVKTIPFSPSPTSLTTEATLAESYHPDEVFFYGLTPSTLLFMHTLASVGYTPPALLTNGGGSDDPTLAASLGNLADYMYNVYPWFSGMTATSHLAAQVATEYQALFGKAMDPTSALAFQGMIALGDAINSVTGNVTPQAVRDALANLDITKTIMPWAGIKFDSSGQNALASAAIVQMQAGEFKAVYPASVAQASAVWPAPAFSSR
jgi:branched-chain amino acid transport system substrate-binding protein